MAPGDRVVIVPSGQPGKFEPSSLANKHGKLLELDHRVHGYARVQIDGDDFVSLVHPESLVKEVEYVGT